MKYVKHIGIPIVSVLAYYLSGLFFASRMADGVIATLVVDLVFGLAFWFYYRKRIKNVRRDVTWFQLAAILPLMYAVWLVSQVTAHCLMQIPDFGWEQHQAAAHVDVGAYVILTVIGAPLLEETLFRGVMYRSMKQLWGVGGAMAVSAVIFGLTHGNLPQFYVGCLMGLMFGLIYECTGRLWVGILSHAIYNGWTTCMAAGLGVPGWMLSPWFLIFGNLILITVMIMGLARYGRPEVSDTCLMIAVSEKDRPDVGQIDAGEPASPELED